MISRPHNNSSSDPLCPFRPPNLALLSLLITAPPIQVAGHHAMQGAMFDLLWHSDATGPELEAFAASQGIDAHALLNLPPNLGAGV